jgi:serine protease
VASSAASTGALLVLLHGGGGAAVARATATAALGRLGAPPAGRSVPEIGLITVRPSAGVTPAALARELRSLPGVVSVEPERRYVPRTLPADPALTAIDFFGPDPNEPLTPAPAAEVKALHYAADHEVVLVAAAADAATAEQGDPANVLQPAGTGPAQSKGLGIDVTAAQFGGARAVFAGFGGEISMAAYGSFEPPSSQQTAPCMGAALGVFGAYPGNPTQLEAAPDPAACRITFSGDPRYATIAGTSMAAPQVAATAAMMRALNPYASLGDVLQTLKRTAQRPRDTGWNSNLGWGILDAGAAVDVIRHLDRLAPVSRLTAPRVTSSPGFVLRWSGHDQRRPGLATSGIAYYEVYASTGGGRPRRIARTRAHSLRFRALPGVRYVFYSVAVDRAGNREAQPVRVLTRVTG